MRLAEMIRELRKENEELRARNKFPEQESLPKNDAETEEISRTGNALGAVELDEDGYVMYTEDLGCMSTQPQQEPVAMRYDFDGYGYLYIDSGSGSDWQTRIKDAEPLYTAPEKHQRPHNTVLVPCDKLKEMQDRLAHLEKMIVCANRYRWLRDRHENTAIDIFSSRTWKSVEDYKKQLDDLIDAEIAKATPECLEMAGIKKASEK